MKKGKPICVIAAMKCQIVRICFTSFWICSSLFLYPVHFFIVILGLANLPLIFIHHCILRTEKQRFFRRATEENWMRSARVPQLQERSTLFCKDGDTLSSRHVRIVCPRSK
jgi:hypothetical protein